MNGETVIFHTLIYFIMLAEVKMFSQIGNTVVTKRKGAYCDLLHDTTIECDSISDLNDKIKQFILNSEYRYSIYQVFYNVPEEPNQNIRSDWRNTQNYFPINLG